MTSVQADASIPKMLMDRQAQIPQTGDMRQMPSARTKTPLTR